MIKAEKKGKSLDVIIRGEPEAVISESIGIIENTAKNFAEIVHGKQTSESIEGVLYSMFMTTIQSLNDEGYNIDSRHIGVSMIALHDVDPKEVEELGRIFFEDDN